MRALAALLILVSSPALAQCTAEYCSNDPAVTLRGNGILGDETLNWSPATPGSLPINDYDVEDVDRPTHAVTVNGSLTFLLISGTSLLLGDPPTPTSVACDPNTVLTCGAIWIHVRACDTQAVCGPWSDGVEVLPHACLVQTGIAPDPKPGAPGNTKATVCERECFPGNGYRIPGVPAC